VRVFDEATLVKALAKFEEERRHFLHRNQQPQSNKVATNQSISRIEDKNTNNGGGTSGTGGLSAALRATEYIKLVDAFEQPKWVYNASRRTFEQRDQRQGISDATSGTTPTTSAGSRVDRFHGSAQERTDMMRQRLAIIQQRLKRHPLFQQAVLVDQKKPSFQLTPIESLAGSSGSRCVLGMLSQIEDGRYYLEDGEAQVPLDLDRLVVNQQLGTSKQQRDPSSQQQQKSQDSFFTETCVVLCEGVMLPGSDIFQVWRMGLPAMTEPRAAVTQAFPNTDLFGDGLIQDRAKLDRAIAFERTLVKHAPRGHFFLVISELWLDEPSQWESLRHVLTGVQHMHTNAIARMEEGQHSNDADNATLPDGDKSAGLAGIILCGNFVSSKSHNNIATYVDVFERLADLLAPRPQQAASASAPPFATPTSVDVTNCHIIIISGPADPTPSRDTLPRPRLTRIIEEAFRAKSALPQRHVHFMSSPSRLRYITKEIVLSREDLTNKIRRHSIIKGSSRSNQQQQHGDDAMDVDSVVNPTKNTNDNDGGDVDMDEEEKEKKGEEDSSSHSIATQLVRTVAEQAHLSPLPLPVKPIIWSLDHALRLYPLPHVTVLADQTSSFSIPYAAHGEAQFINPGSFARDLSFGILFPLVGQFDVYSANDA
jgi:DNA polymerase epsilon subunit 2